MPEEELGMPLCLFYVIAGAALLIAALKELESFLRLGRSQKLAKDK